MSYCVTENPASARMLDEQHAAEDAQQRAVELAAANFRITCRAGNAAAPVDWAPLRRRFKTIALRRAMLHELVTDCLDYGTGPDDPSSCEMVQLVLDLANTGNQQAIDFLDRCAWAWAEQNAEAAP